MLHSTTHTSLSLSLFSGFSSMVALPINNREENSPQEKQQCSNANHTPRPNLNVLLPLPDEIILVPNNFRDPCLSSEYDNDEYFGDEDSEDKKQEEKIRQLEFWLCLFGELGNMLSGFILQPNQIYYLPFI
ncbi:hypothetical protein ES288_D03G105700v1 [Gossypium darwinii]|uniref:Uncharacterized protein n=1 Tax=Gossypium darwinii TaxID=34276 RepID=A0A5D2D4I3_GOSDA|nr:hypothetical protein ES288_D03G105700v1 [Gossypium darwinii]